MSRHTPYARMHGRGTVPVLVLLILAAGAVVIVHVLKRRAAAEHAARVAPAPTSTAATAARHARHAMTMGHAQLLAAAGQALAEHRLLAPAGDNAFAYYLEARKRQPHHPVAAAALRELFPFAVQSAEQSINAGRLDQAQREIALLDRADPTNYSLNILRAKLDAQQRLANTQTPPPTRPTRPARPTPHPSSPALVHAAQAQVPTVARQPTHAETRARARVARVRPARHEVERTPPLLLRDVQPAYPAAARRAHRQGWVEVSYTVDREGKVVDAQVVDAHPTHVFDVAALSAVRHWEFRPARVDGQAVSQKVRSRIEFNL